MEDRKDYTFFIFRLIADCVIVAISWFLAYFLRFYIIPGSQGEIFLFIVRTSVLIVPLYVTIFNRNKLYQSMRNLSWIDEMQRVVLSSIQAVFLIIITLYFFYPSRVSRLTLLMFFLIVTISLIIERIMVKNYLITLRANGKNQKRVLIIGQGIQLENYVKIVKENSGYGLSIIGQFDSGESPIRDVYQVTGTLENCIKTMSPDIVVLSYPSEMYAISLEHLSICYDMLFSVIIIPDLPFSLIGTKISEFNFLPIMHINHANLTFFNKFEKRVFDLSISLAGFIILIPLFVILGLLIKLTSKGPVFYKQKRVTENGREFNMLKFRSMKNELASEELRWTEKNDTRVTKFGQFLRCSSLDELPQLLNVIKGDMSLIGPRPERPEFVKKFEREIPGYRLRHKVKSGISGWAQVNGWRGNTSLEKRIESDLYYIRNWSTLLDLKILFLTLIKGFVNTNAY